jgi:hypothetical protein
MKKNLVLILFFLASAVAFGQAPYKMSYQAVVRDGAGLLVASQAVGMQVSILQGTEGENTVYVETHQPMTNQNGLVSFEIGTGTAISGEFAAIDWSAGPYHIKIEADPEGGSNYTVSGISELVSVPYALHAATAESLTGGVEESDPIFVGSPAFTISNENLVHWNAAFNWGDHAQAGYLTSLSETDPLFAASPAFGISETNIAGWNTAFGWGNHADAGYLSSFTENDPLFAGSAAFGISLPDISNWNTAFGWGDHSLAGYLTSFTESDPIFGVSVASGITAADTTFWNNKLDQFTETDPLFVFSPAYLVTSESLDDWNEAFSWGNHADANYFSSGGDTATTHRTLGNLDAFALSLITGSVTRLHISESGNIGIGTLAPSNSLSVAGVADFQTSVQTPRVLPLPGDGAALSVQTNNAAVGSGSILMRTGNTTNTGGQANTGSITIETGSMNNNGGTTGSITLKAGRSINAAYDGSQLVLGGYPNYNGGGGVNLSSGNGWSGAGNIMVKAGNAGWGSGGNITLQAGDGGAQAGNGGNIIFNTGNDAGGGTGIIQFLLAGTEHFRLDKTGRVGIGTTAPTAKLDVQGSVKIADGSQGPNKVLTSDENGLASWQTPLAYTAGTGIEISGQVIKLHEPFYLGQDTLGGIVYYLYKGEDGLQHGLIVSKTETTAQYQRAETTTNAIRSWDGAYNTGQMTNSPAKEWITGNFSGEWYLPSIDELGILWQNRFHVNKALYDAGAVLLSNTDLYWSSTEYNLTNAFQFHFGYAYAFDYANKPSAYRVRAVRAF